MVYLKSLVNGVIAIVVCMSSMIVSRVASAQVNPQDSVVASPLINFHYSYQLPGGDMARRFGNNNSIGASFVYKTKSNFLFGVEGSFLFGENVIEDPIADLRVDLGQIVSEGGTYANLAMLQRGFYFTGTVGKIFPILSPNKNSGPMIRAGVGYLQHNIRYQVDRNTVPQLRDGYEKGYDRLTSGIMFQQFIGYRLFSNSRLINFYVGVEFIQGLTQNQRSFNFDTRERDDRQRNDLLTGFKFGWTIPLYKKTPREFYYN